MNLAINKKTYLTIAVFSGLIAIISLLLVWPLIKQIKTSGQELIQSQETMAIFFQNWRNLETSRQQSKEIEEKLAETKFIMPADEAINFIVALENAALATNNSQEISVLTSKKEEAIDFQVTVNGSFPNLLKFMAYLENLSYYNQIASLQINRLESTQISPTKNIFGLTPGDVKSIIRLSVPVK